MADLTGRRFDMLVVESLHPDRSPSGGAKWNCRCDCGNMSVAYANNLLNGTSGSCGCRRSAALDRTTHGGTNTPEYAAWANMLQRCRNANNPGYDLYGGRGVQVCARWAHSFESFLADMGSRPSETHSLERLDVNGNYEPGNCSWATKEVQSNNTRRNVIYEIEGQKFTQSQLARSANMSPQLLRQRLAAGMDLQEALTKEVGKGRPKGDSKKK